MKIDPDGLVEIKFRVEKAPEFDSLFFVPFYEKNNEQKHLILLAQTPKNSRVLLGTLAGDPKQPEVKEEKVAVMARSSRDKGS